MDSQIKVAQTQSQFEIKVNYLQEENKLLKERIQDLEEIIKLNKKAFERSITLENKQKQDLSKHKSSNSNSLEDQVKFLRNITDELTKENSYLNLKIEKLMKERDLAKDKALVSEQVANEFKRQEKETTNDYKTELGNLKKKLEDRERKIKEIQTGGIFRIKNVVSPEEKSLYFHSEIEGYRNVLSKALKKIKMLRTEKDELVKLNQQFFNEIIKMKEIMSLQPQNGNNAQTVLLSSHQNVNIFTATNQTLNLLEYHKKFYKINEEDSSIEEISPLHSPLPCRVDPINSTGKKNQEIPKLDINKAILIQEMTLNEKNKKNGSELPQREVVLQASTNAEKIKKKFLRVESELKRTKKLLQNEMLENQLLKSQMCKLDEENVSLKNKNKFLVEAQKSFEVKWKKINNLLTIYKHYNSKPTHRQQQSTNPNLMSKIHNRNKSENNYNFLYLNIPSANKFSTESLAISNNNNDLLSTDEINNYREFDFLETRIREQLMTDKESRRIVNLSLIDSEDYKNEDFSERGQYIKFLQNMGTYLNQIYKTSNLRKRNCRSNSLILNSNLGSLSTRAAFYPAKIKKPSQILSDNNKYQSLRFDFKETLNRFKSRDFKVPNPRMERNLISPISKPNYNERGTTFNSVARLNLTNNASTPVHLSIGNLGSEEVFF